MTRETKPRFEVDPEIARARGLSAQELSTPSSYADQLEKVFARSWHLVAATDPVPEARSATPLTLLEGSLDEPIVFTRDEVRERHCLSNVCTHRANLVVGEACQGGSLRCRYHGRRFSLDGRFAHMPEFEGAEGFPSPADDLARVPFAEWGSLLFAGVAPRVPFEDWFGPLFDRLGFVAFDRLALEGPPRHYEVAANWTLYCDNYLEGFHIPFVHGGLAEALDYGAYETSLFEWGTLQVGVAKENDDLLVLPEGHPDRGRKVAALYAFLFPATMINVYPWGLSLNAIRPLGPERTRITYFTLRDPALPRDGGAGGDLDRVEMEDEAVVESVARGVRSRFYRPGRFSPSRETGVHHFHRLLARELA